MDSSASEVCENVDGKVLNQESIFLHKLGIKLCHPTIYLSYSRSRFYEEVFHYILSICKFRIMIG
jgi:hypothetical protein